MNVIDRARERIERDGWWREPDVGRTGPNASCIANAISDEAEDVSQKDAAWSAVLAELGFPPEASLRHIWRFNDDPSTSLEDVLLVLKRASARLDEATP